QSGSTSVLTRMRRKYSAEFYKEKVKKLKKALPGLAITTDVIVGFPGETEEEFMETYNFIQDIGYAELHVFQFSRRTGTPAARMENQVDKEVKETRVTKLIELSNQLAKQHASRFENQVNKDVKETRVIKLIELSNQLAKQYASRFEHDVLEVIPEEKSSTEAGILIGYTDNYLKVQFEGSPDLIGSIVKVKLTK